MRLTTPRAEHTFLDHAIPGKARSPSPERGLSLICIKVSTFPPTTGGGRCCHLPVTLANPDQARLAAPQTNTSTAEDPRGPGCDVRSQEIVSGSAFKEKQNVRKQERAIEYKYLKNIFISDTVACWQGRRVFHSNGRCSASSRAGSVTAASRRQRATGDVCVSEGCFCRRLARHSPPPPCPGSGKQAAGT